MSGDPNLNAIAGLPPPLIQRLKLEIAKGFKLLETRPGESPRPIDPGKRLVCGAMPKGPYPAGKNNSILQTNPIEWINEAFSIHNPY